MQPRPQEDQFVPKNFVVLTPNEKYPLASYTLSKSDPLLSFRSFACIIPHSIPVRYPTRTATIRNTQYAYFEQDSNGNLARFFSHRLEPFFGSLKRSDIFTLVPQSIHFTIQRPVGAYFMGRGRGVTEVKRWVRKSTYKERYGGIPTNNNGSKNRRTMRRVSYHIVFFAMDGTNPNPNPIPNP